MLLSELLRYFKITHFIDYDQNLKKYKNYFYNIDDNVQFKHYFNHKF